jgi:hypothetical protein
MEDIVRDTVAKIRDRGIVPEPRSVYLTWKSLIWVTLGAVVLFGALSFSVAYFLLSSLDWDLYRFMRLDPLTYAFSIFPYFWTILIVALLVAAFADFRRTETGYRFGRSKIVLSIIGCIVIFGMVMSFFGIGEAFGVMIAKDFPYYGRHLVVTKEAQWMQPDYGLLSGTIDEYFDETIGLKDLSGKRWDVTMDAQTSIKPSVSLSSGEMIKVMGERTGERAFRAIEIRPWNGRGPADRIGEEMSGNGVERHGRMNK